MKNTVLTSNQKIQARLNAAGAMTIAVSWEDQKATLTSRGGTVIDITGTSYTDIVPAPGATVIRTITAFNIINTGSNNTVFVGLFNGTATKEFLGALLNTRWRLDEDGVRDNNGVLQFVGAAGTAPVLTATSSTSNTLSVGNGKSFTVSNAVRQLSVGQRMIAAVTGQATTRYMIGRLATFNNTNITIDVQNAADVVGTGTSTTWSLGLAAEVAGLNGTNFLQGSGVPPALVGAEGDSYLDVTNGDLYGKNGGVWGVTGNLKGEDGADGADGLNGVNAVMTAISTDNRPIQSGAVTFDIPNSTNRGWLENNTRLRASANANTFMEGVVQSLSPTSVTINIEFTRGSGSYSTWNISVAGERGEQGAPGAGADDILPAKCVLFDTSSNFTPRVTAFDVATLRFRPAISMPMNYGNSLNLATKTSTKEIFAIAANGVAFLTNQVQQVSALNTLKSNGLAQYHAPTNSLYGLDQSNNFARLDVATNVLTSSALNNPLGNFAVGGGYVILLENSGVVRILDSSTLALLGTPSVPGVSSNSFAVWNPLKNVFAVTVGGGYYEVNPNPVSVSSIFLVTNLFYAIEFFGGNYYGIIDGATETVVEINGTTNAILRTFTGISGVSGANQMVIADGKVFLVGNNLIVFDITSGTAIHSQFVQLGNSNKNRAIYFEP